jgi:hypothetical protein
MLFERQRTLLAFLDAMGGSLGSLDLEKLLFLYTREEEVQPTYEFVPYRFGCFSFTSYADGKRLCEQGLLVNEERQWSAARTHDAGTRLRMDRFARKHAALRGEPLVADVYRRYPYWAIHSEMAGRLLSGDKAALEAVQSASPPPRQPGVCTIGYEGVSLEGYLNRLLRDGVTLLCDVRRNPLSRKYGFSKKTLAHACVGVGLRYEHLPELGIASDRRRELATPDDYEVLFAEYAERDLPAQGQALGRIAAWVCDERQRVALTCFERLPQQCHRHCVADALAARYGRGLAAVHL